MKGNELRTLRKGAGFSQLQLAEAIGVKAATISSWERKNLSIQKRFQVAILALLREPAPATRSWDSPSKPIFAPSHLVDYSCKLKFKLKHLDFLEARESVEALPTLGTLVHAGEAAVDLQKDGKRAIRAETKEIAKKEPVSGPIPLLSQLEKEAILLVEGGSFVDGKNQPRKAESYRAWKAKQKEEFGDWEILAVEKRFYVDIGPVILAPQLDLAIRNDDGVWPVERKTRSGGDKDAGYLERYRLNTQLLVQMLVAENVWKKDTIAGAMVRVVYYNRQKKKDWESALPQPLSSTSRDDPLWVRRSPETMALFYDRLVELRADYECRMESSSWPADGLTNGSCRFCEFAACCRGERPFADLKRRELRDVDREIQKRREKRAASEAQGIAARIRGR